MSPLTISAQFAAFVWFTGRPENAGTSHAVAMQFARDHWAGFLPLAHRGLGRLLLKIANPRKPRRRCDSPATPRPMRAQSFSQN